MKLKHAVFISVSLLGSTLGAQVQQGADDAFRALQLFSHPRTTGTSTDHLVDEQGMQLATFVMTSTKAKEFYEKYPDHPKAAEARKIEVISKLRAARAGGPEQEGAALRLARDYRSNSKNSTRDRFEVATLAKEVSLQKKNLKSRDELIEEYEKSALDLYGEFPDEPAVFDMLMGIARTAPSAKAKSISEQVLRMPAPGHVKQEAREMIERVEMPGKSLSIEWVDTTGKSHRSTDYTGKVIVFYVWASWTPASAEADQLVKEGVPPSAILVSVNVDNDAKKAAEAKAKSGISAIDYSDSRGLGSSLAKQLRAAQVPSVHVISPSGVFVGSGSPRELPTLLQAAAK